jgi:recombination protein RecT
MTTTTATPEPAGKDVARRPDQLVQSYTSEFAQVLPSHVSPEVFTRVAIGALRKNPALMQAAERDTTSLMTALMEAARLGLEPGTDEFYLTPRGGSVLGIVGYQGEIELIYRAGAVTSVKAEIVRDNDTFRWGPGMERPIHEVQWFAARGEVLGAYAYAEMVGGGISKVVVIGPEEIDRSRSASATANSKSSPWTTDFAAMVLKTAIHQLAKWVPTSAEYRREQIRAAVEIARELPDGPPPMLATVHSTATRIATEVPGVYVDPDGVVYDSSAEADQ